MSSEQIPDSKDAMKSAQLVSAVRKLAEAAAELKAAGQPMAAMRIGAVLSSIR